jgi:hypothetical protein
MVYPHYGEILLVAQSHQNIRKEKYINIILYCRETYFR